MMMRTYRETETSTITRHLLGPDNSSFRKGAGEVGHGLDMNLFARPRRMFALLRFTNYSIGERSC